MSFRFRGIAAAVAVATLALGAGADAAVLNITGDARFKEFVAFEPVGAGSGGVHGIELRGARDNVRQDWQLGIGQGTSRPGNFAQGNIDWASPPAGAWDFTFSFGPTSSLTLSKGEVTQTVTWQGPEILRGNAVRFDTKGVASLSVASIAGRSVTGGAFDGGSLLYYSAGGLLNAPFTMTGQLEVLKGGGSANGVIVKTGSVAPVPVPAALPLILGGLAIMGFVARRRSPA